MFVTFWYMSVFSFSDRHILLCLKQFITYYAKHKLLKKEKKKGKDAEQSNAEVFRRFLFARKSRRRRKHLKRTIAGDLARLSLSQ